MLKDSEPTWKSLPTKLEGVRIIQRPSFKDDRGQFSTLFHVKHSLEGVPTVWAQENLSISLFGVLRGMHFQVTEPQGKLVTCVCGSIWDVWTDLRPESPTYLQSESIQLDSEEMSSVYIPPGFAHGFLVMSKFASVHYKTTTPFNKEYDRSVRWDSAEFRGMWPEDFQPALSDKDIKCPTLGEFLQSLS